MTDQQDNDRLSELEVRFSFQEDVIEKLNDVVTEQWKHIENLTRKMQRMEDRLREALESNDSNPADEPPPPHY